MTDNFNPHLMLGVFYLRTFLYIFIMIQENKTLSVRVDMTYVNGRFNFQLFAEKEVKPEMLRAMLVGGVALTIKAEEGPEKQGVAMKDVIDYLTNEFISTDSFENAKYVQPED
jgi:hypothetical protein